MSNTKTSKAQLNRGSFDALEEDRMPNMGLADPLLETKSYTARQLMRLKRVTQAPCDVNTCAHSQQMQGDTTVEQPIVLEAANDAVHLNSCSAFSLGFPATVADRQLSPL